MSVWYGDQSTQENVANFGSASEPEGEVCVAQVACDLELWQEAFRTVEDVQNLFVLGKRPGKPQTMATFYARLTRIFTVSENHLQNGWEFCPCCTCAHKFDAGRSQSQGESQHTAAGIGI